MYTMIVFLSRAYDNGILWGLGKCHEPILGRLAEKPS
jgi:hypothetical protein